MKRITATDADSLDVHRLPIARHFRKSLRLSSGLFPPVNPSNHPLGTLEKGIDEKKS